MNPWLISALILGGLLALAAAGFFDWLLRPLYRRLNPEQWEKVTSKARDIREHGEAELEYRKGQWWAQGQWFEDTFLTGDEDED